MANTPHFSPVRLKASSEEAAISQALMMVGATRDEVEVEVIETTEKGVTIRVSPRRDTADVSEQTTEAVVEEAEEEIIEAPDFMDDDFDSDEEESVKEETEQEAPAPVVAREADPAQVQRAQELAQEFLQRMDLQADVNVVPPPSATVEEVENATPIVYLDIEGEDVGILIGKHGQTLQSFQYLLNLTLNNRVHETDGDERDALRVIVDAGGYRSRRASSLDQAARNAANRAKRDRRPIRLEPMPAHERRLVHIALRSDGEIATSSEGREPNRYVVITPANNRSGAASSSQGGYNGRRGPRRSSSSNSFGGGSRRGGR